jgi:hypothetical protein
VTPACVGAANICAFQTHKLLVHTLEEVDAASDGHERGGGGRRAAGHAPASDAWCERVRRGIARAAPVCVAVARQHPFTRRARLHVADLRDQLLTLGPTRGATGYNAAVTAIWRAAGLSPKTIHSTGLAIQTGDYDPRAAAGLTIPRVRGAPPGPAQPGASRKWTAVALAAGARAAFVSTLGSTRLIRALEGDSSLPPYALYRIAPAALIVRRLTHEPWG